MELLWKLREYFSGNKKRVVKVLGVMLLIAAAFFFKSYADRKSAIEVSEDISSEATESVVTEFYVDISGCVNSPGVYEVDSETRLFDVIEMAGGLTADADIDSINRAELLEDGQKILIPSKDESASSTSGTVSASSGSVSGKININTADQATLMEISGVGETIANRIIEYRAENRFSKIEDIKNVKGIGDATYEKMADLITV